MGKLTRIAIGLGIVGTGMSGCEIPSNSDTTAQIENAYIPGDINSFNSFADEFYEKNQIPEEFRLRGVEAYTAFKVQVDENKLKELVNLKKECKERNLSLGFVGLLQRTPEGPNPIVRYFACAYGKEGGSPIFLDLGIDFSNPHLSIASQLSAFQTERVKTATTGVDYASFSTQLEVPTHLINADNPNYDPNGFYDAALDLHSPQVEVLTPNELVNTIYTNFQEDGMCSFSNFRIPQSQISSIENIQATLEYADLGYNLTFYFCENYHAVASDNPQGPVDISGLSQELQEPVSNDFAALKIITNYGDGQYQVSIPGDNGGSAVISDSEGHFTTQIMAIVEPIKPESKNQKKSDSSTSDYAPFLIPFFTILTIGGYALNKWRKNAHTRKIESEKNKKHQDFLTNSSNLLLELLNVPQNLTELGQQITRSSELMTLRHDLEQIIPYTIGQTIPDEQEAIQAELENIYNTIAQSQDQNPLNELIVQRYLSQFFQINTANLKAYSIEDINEYNDAVKTYNTKLKEIDLALRPRIKEKQEIDIKPLNLVIEKNTGSEIPTEIFNGIINTSTSGLEEFLNLDENGGKILKRSSEDIDLIVDTILSLKEEDNFDIDKLKVFLNLHFPNNRAVVIDEGRKSTELTSIELKLTGRTDSLIIIYNNVIGNITLVLPQ